MPDWLQDLCDLMSNHLIRLTIEGDCVAVKIILEMNVGYEWNEIAQVYDSDSLPTALAEVMTKFRTGVNRYA